MLALNNADSGNVSTGKSFDRFNLSELVLVNIDDNVDDEDDGNNVVVVDGDDDDNNDDDDRDGGGEVDRILCTKAR